MSHPIWIPKSFTYTVAFLALSSVGFGALDAVAPTLMSQAGNQTGYQFGHIRSPASTRTITQPVIIGNDDRKEPYQISSSQIKTQRKSVALQVPKSFLTLNPSTGLYDLNSVSYQDLQFCSRTQFFEQPISGVCTAFLVSPDTLMTAGHCVEEANICDNYAWVFGFEKNSDGSITQSFLPKDVVECTSTETQYPAGADWGLVTLTEPITDRTPLELNLKPSPPPTGTNLYQIGHPNGIPLKINTVGKVKEYWNGFEKIIVTDLDALTGNSGSPVFSSESGKVIGITVLASKADEVVSSQGGISCYALGRYSYPDEYNGLTPVFLTASRLTQIQAAKDAALKNLVLNSLPEDRWIALDLVERGANPDQAADSTGASLLEWSLRNNQDWIRDWLLTDAKANPRVRIAGSRWKSLLWIAIEQKDLESFDKLRDAGLKPTRGGFFKRLTGKTEKRRMIRHLKKKIKSSGGADKATYKAMLGRVV